MHALEYKCLSSEFRSRLSILVSRSVLAVVVCLDNEAFFYGLRLGLSPLCDNGILFESGLFGIWNNIYIFFFFLIAFLIT